MTRQNEKSGRAPGNGGLTERLRRAATVSDAGPGNAEPMTAKSDRDVILELNEAIQEIIAGAPLTAPGSHPDRSPIDRPQDCSAPPCPPLPPVEDVVIDMSAMQQTSVLQSHPVPQHQSDDGDLQDWLNRLPDDRPDPPSRGRIVALCAGTMLLSILAGYGSAQLVNIYPGDGDQVAVDRLALPAAPQSPVDDAMQEEFPDDESVVPTVSEDNPARPAYRVASISGFSGTVPEPVPAESEPVPVENAQEPAAEPEPESVPASPASTEVASAPVSAAQATIPGDEMERLFIRAEQLIADRDIAAARLVLRHLAEAGSGPAALKLAEAYDPEWLAANGAAGVPANKDLALRWYAMARERGEDGAEARIAALEAK